MRWSFRLGRIGGTEIRVHATFFLLLLWIGFAQYSVGGLSAAIEGIVFILALFACVVLHEFGHAIAARKYGIKTPDITLLPIGGVARLQRMPDQPKQELVVALAGPAVNVVIAIGLLLGLGGATRFYDITQLDNPTVGFLTKLLIVNVWLVIFNLIPAFPMDGGRVLRAVLAMGMDYARATRIAATTGQTLAFVFGLLGLFYNPLLILIAFVVYIGATQEATMVELRETARNMSVADAMITDFRTLPASATLDDAAEALLRTSQHDFPVTDDDGTFVGLLTRDNMISGLRKSGPATPISEVMHRNIRIVPVTSGFEDAVRWISESNCPAVLVSDRSGKIVGMLTPENLGELMMVQSALSRSSTTAWQAPEARPVVHRA